MLDEDSLTVTYNDWRGEPRSLHAKKAAAEGKLVGDCVDCNACVAVCPMGIDIRDGQQLECITCALCIDACDGVMEKIGKEHGLISYATLRDYNANLSIATAGSGAVADIRPDRIRSPEGGFTGTLAHTTWRSIIRPRTILYTAVWGLIGIALLIALGLRDRLDVNVLHDRNPVFVLLSDGSIRNGYEIKILNMIAEPRSFMVEVEGLPDASMSIAGSSQNLGQSFEIEVPSDKILATKVFVRMPREAITATRSDFRFVVTEIDGKEKAAYDARFEAPAEAVGK